MKMLQYRIDMLLWTVASVSSALVAMAIWYTVAAESGQVTLAHATLVYYIFVSFLTTVTVAWAGFFMAQDILTGDIVKYLLRPFSAFWFHVVNNIVEKTVRLLIPIPLLLYAIIFYPSFFANSIVPLKLLPIAIVSILLAITISFLIDIALGLCAFWLQDAMQIRRYQDLLFQVTSGILIPYSFLPPNIKNIFSILPYRYIIAAPAEILSGQASIHKSVEFIVIQILWIMILFSFVSYQWKRGLARYAPPG